MARSVQAMNLVGMVHCLRQGTYFEVGYRTMAKFTASRCPKVKIRGAGSGQGLDGSTCLLNDKSQTWALPCPSFSLSSPSGPLKSLLSP